MSPIEMTPGGLNSPLLGPLSARGLEASLVSNDQPPPYESLIAPLPPAGNTPSSSEQVERPEGGHAPLVRGNITQVLDNRMRQIDNKNDAKDASPENVRRWGHRLIAMGLTFMVGATAVGGLLGAGAWGVGVFPGLLAGLIIGSIVGGLIASIGYLLTECSYPRIFTYEENANALITKLDNNKEQPISSNWEAIKKEHGEEDAKYYLVQRFDPEYSAYYKNKEKLKVDIESFIDAHDLNKNLFGSEGEQLHHTISELENDYISKNRARISKNLAWAPLYVIAAIIASK